jgi:hypothetical protein
MIPVSARRVVMFHPSHILKALVQQQRPVDSRVKTLDAVQPKRVEYAEEYSVPG